MASAVVLESDNTSHEQNMCDACARVNETISAFKWCKDCKEGLCEPCSKAHIRSKATSKHLLIPMEDVTELEIVASKLDININCTTHIKKPLELYCSTHQTFCCSICECTNHRECPNVIPIGDISKAYVDKKILEKQTAAFVEIQKTVQSSIDEKSSCLHNLDRDKSSILSKASDIVTKVKKRLDTLYSDFEKKVIREHTAVEQSQKRMRTLLEDFQNIIIQNTFTMQTLSHVSPDESVIMMETLKAETLKRCQQIEGKLKQNSNQCITFKLDPTMPSLFDNLSSVGDVVKECYGLTSSVDMSSIQKIINVVDIRNIVGIQVQYPVLPRRDVMTADVKLVKVITDGDLGHQKKGNNFFDFTCGKFMGNGHLLLADYNNRELMILNEDMMIMRDIKVNGQPSCLDLSDDEKVVHVVCDRNSVHRYSLQDGHEVDRRMEVDGDAWDIAVSGDTTIIGHGCVPYYDFYVRSYERKCTLYEGKGNTIHSVTTGGNTSRIAVSNNGEQIYYSSGRTIIACDRGLNENWRYKSDDLSGSAGICVDPYDNVYVVGCYSKNVHQISSDGTRHRVIVRQMNKIRYPEAIAFNKNMDMFVVTSHGEDVAFEVYEFSP